MTESKHLERDIEHSTRPADPSVGTAPERFLEAIDIHGKGMPKISAAEAPLGVATTIVEPQNSWNNRRDATRELGLPTGALHAAPDHQTPLAAKAEATSLVDKTPRSESVWPVVVEPADRAAVAVWRNEGDPN